MVRVNHPSEPASVNLLPVNHQHSDDSPSPVTAADAVDRIILHEAEELVAQHQGRIVVIDDENAALVAGLSADAGAVRVHCDSWTAEQRVVALDRGATSVHAELDADLLGGATVVLLRLPKSLAALEEIGRAVARHADPEVLVIAGGRDKHMSRGMNAALEKSFSDVAGSLGRQKCRALLARAPRKAGPRSEETASAVATTVIATTEPARKRHDDLDLVVCAYGAAFAGTSVDLGTRFLLSFLDQTITEVTDVVDLGCGTGILAAALARRHPGARVLGVDDSAAACRSTLATARANGLADRIRVRRGDGLLDQEDESADLILCNPPFHRGTTRDSSVAFTMFADSERILRPGGQLWTVFNTHLPYRQALRQSVGPTKIMGQNADYMVTRSIRAD